jgi:biotin-dependent carboxylase-like uncharacterized protein
LEVLAESVRVAFVGGGNPLIVQHDGERKIPPGRSVTLKRGASVRIGALSGSASGYLAVEGGFDVPLSLRSAATYVRGGLGGVEGRALRAGDELESPQDKASDRGDQMLSSPFTPDLAAPIRVVLGPQDNYFSRETIAVFLRESHIVSAQADRMGFRLDGPELAHVDDYNIVSDGTVSGSIQVPGSRQPIILMVDAQTVGGYPKIATVISADMPLLGRRGPGSKIHFQAVTREEAETIRRMQEKAIVQMIASFQLAQDQPAVDLKALYNANLIDGLVSALD